MKTLAHLLLAATCAALLTGCKKDDTAPVPVPVATGSISGYVSAYDENGVAAAKSGTVVSVDNSSPQLAATTDASGKFELPAVPTGTYNLTFARPGFGTFRRIGVGHLGGPEATFLANTVLAQASGTAVTGLLATGPLPNGNFAVDVAAANPTPGAAYRVAVFVSATPGVTAGTGTLLGVFVLNAATQTLSLTKRDLNGAGVASGSHVYAVAYGAPANNPAYVDPGTGRAVYPALNPNASPVIDFVAP